MKHLRAAGCRTIYINGSFVTDKLNPNDFDACWDVEGVDLDYLRTNAPTLLNLHDKRAAQKAKYRGELFPSELIADDTGLTFLEFFQHCVMTRHLPRSGGLSNFSSSVDNINLTQ